MKKRGSEEGFDPLSPLATHPHEPIIICPLIPNLIVPNEMSQGVAYRGYHSLHFDGIIRRLDLVNSV